jgi:hypothetical protein
MTTERARDALTTETRDVIAELRKIVEAAIDLCHKARRRESS